MSLPPSVRLTPAAVERVRSLMARADGAVRGLRVGIAQKGCSGLSYRVDYAEDGPRPLEETIEQDGAILFLEPGALLYLIGSEMDYRADALQASFVFNNPNEKARCGCGESFAV